MTTRPAVEGVAVRSRQHDAVSATRAADRRADAPLPGGVALLQLQRAIGNRACTGLLPRTGARGRSPMRLPAGLRPDGAASNAAIHRRFDTGDEFLTATAHGVPMLQTIADAMDAYNAYLDKEPKGPVDTEGAAKSLKLIERTIFSYVSSQNAAHEKLADIPHYAALEALRVQAGAEHEEFVQQSVTNDDLPFDFSAIPKQESTSLIILWNQIKGGLGKIKLVGDLDHQKRIRSWLVKLLETPTGRQLLGHLNAGDPTEALTNIYIGETKEQLPGGVEAGAKAKGKALENTGVSEAQPLGTAGELLGPYDLVGDEKPSEYLTAQSPAAFRTALMQGKKGVIVNDKKYDFNKKVSVGAFVTAHEGASKNESAVHHQIMTPGWLTMGHELGHAAHMRGGGTNMMDVAQTPGQPGIMESLTGEDSEKLSAKWQNGEEFLTINNWENSLRADVGLTARDSHIPYTAGKKVERYYSIWPDVKATFRDAIYLETPSLAAFKKDLRAAFNGKDPATNLENDQVYQALQQRWLVLRTTNLDAEAKQKKKDRIKLKYDDMNSKYNRKRVAYSKKWFPGKAEKAEWQTLIQERASVVDIYTNHLDDHIDMNVAPQDSLFVKLEKRLEALDKGFYDFSV